MAEMSVELATKKFRDFCVSELRGRCSSKGWTKIDGSRLCSTCARKKRRTLYALINEGSAVYLKCFRASCDLKRFATYEDFEDLGFTDKEAIKVLMNRTNRIDIREYNTDSRPIYVGDRILSKEQRDYFKKRTKLDLTIEDVYKYRIIPNLFTVMDENFDDDDPIMDKFISMNIQSDKKAIAFATSDYSTVSYRHVFRNQKVIFNLSDNQNNGYTLERYAEGSDEIKTLVLSEGIFDMINIYNFYAYIYGAKYIATLGFQSFLSDIVYWYRQHIDTVERLILFVDSDKDLPYGNKTYDKYAVDNLIKNVKKELGEDAFKEIHIVYNTKSKDFGDRSLPIEPKIVTVKGGA